MTVEKLLEAAGRPVEIVDVADGLGPALNVCRARSAVIVKLAEGVGPAEIGAGLAGWRRTLTVSDSGELTTVDPRDAVTRRWTAPDAVLCLADTEFLVSNDGWALPDDSFASRSHVLGAEVRAFVLARLAPRPGVLVWDVLAGSGAVAVECARLGAAVLAVEPDPVQCVRIIANASAHGVDVRVEETELDTASLPRPDAVFVGRAQLAEVKACAAVNARRVVVVTERVDEIVPARDAVQAAGYEVEGVHWTASRLLDSGFAPAVPVTVLWGTKK
jgi:precorrin-6B C5,15-methyltransferase / cobalt-precorrin-6B C5,C15-methyltransferase